MAIKLKGIPFDANEIILPDGTLGYDNILYSADFAEWLGTYFSNGILVPKGQTLSSELKVEKTDDSVQVTINPGNLVANGRTAFITETATLEIIPSEPDLLRMDRVVIEMNLEDDFNLFQLKIVEGTLAVDPVPPELVRTNEIYQMSLATLTVDTSGITEVEDNRAEDDLCGISNVLIGIKPPLPVPGDSATNIKYDNTSSGLSGVNVQEALDELAGTDEQKVLSKDNWTADSTGEFYTQTVTMTGYTSTMRAPLIDVVPASKTDQTYFSYIWKVDTVADGLKFYASVALPADITVKVR